MHAALDNVTPVADELGRAVLRKAVWRLVPFLCLMYALNILDRANVGFARTAMESDLKISEAEFNLAYGLFYIGYLAFEVPSNLLLRRFGARRWMSRIMISWGLVSCATMFVTEAWNFYAIRILLGVAEAGFFPGIILYLTYWFPARERARVTSYFMIAIALASIFGNPLSGAIMQYGNGVLGFKGWQWLFLLEGLPSVVIGMLVIHVLTDRPEQARWLTSEECDWLSERLRREEQERKERHGADRLLAMMDWRVWLLICLYFTVAVGANAGGAHMPKMVETHYPQADKIEIGFLMALPHVCAIVAMTLFSASSDRTGERRMHVALAALLAAAGWSLTSLAPGPAWVLVGLCLAQAGMMSILPTFWTMPTGFLTGAAAAGGIALINSVANIGGFFGPTILGRLGPDSMAAILFAGAGLAMCVRRERAQ